MVPMMHTLICVVITVREKVFEGEFAFSRKNSMKKSVCRAEANNDSANAIGSVLSQKEAPAVNSLLSSLSMVEFAKHGAAIGALECSPGHVHTSFHVDALRRTG